MRGSRINAQAAIRGFGVRFELEPEERFNVTRSYGAAGNRKVTFQVHEITVTAEKWAPRIVLWAVGIPADEVGRDDATTERLKLRPVDWPAWLGAVVEERQLALSAIYKAIADAHGEEPS